ncbi:MAG: type IV pilus assembly protein PilM [Desulfotomaculaceae bacterium]|nr:type IV pilus assembly protein PilM [Desulfotomaculaceae bacterium]
MFSKKSRAASNGGASTKTKGSKKKNFRQGFLSLGLLRKIAPKKNRFAAIDIGNGNIKVVEVSVVEGLPEVTASGSISMPAGALDEPVNEEALVAALNELVLTSGIQLREVITTIGGDKVITRHIKLPLMPEKELATAVRFEVEKFIPTPVSELQIRHLKLSVTEENGEKTVHLLVAAVPTSYIYDFYRIFALAGLTVAAIDLQTLSLWRVFCGISPKPACQGTVGILDIGASTTQFLVVRERLLEFTRTLPVGGKLLTNSLAEYYGFEFQQASDVKLERGRLLSAEEAAATSQEDMQIDFSLRAGLSELVREIRRSIDFYASQEGATPIERFIISGGAVKLLGFCEFLAEALEAPVEFGEPGLPGQPVNETAPEAFDQAYAVVLGSALREVVE